MRSWPLRRTHPNAVALTTYSQPSRITNNHRNRLRDGSHPDTVATTNSRSTPRQLPNSRPLSPTSSERLPNTTNLVNIEAARTARSRKPNEQPILPTNRQPTISFSLVLSIGRTTITHEIHSTHPIWSRERTALPSELGKRDVSFLF